MRLQSEVDLTLLENWNKENVGFIAERFGYVLNERFIEAVTAYRNSIGAVRVKDFIPIFGERFLKGQIPPLDRLTHPLINTSPILQAQSTPSPTQNRRKGGIISFLKRSK